MIQEIIIGGILDVTKKIAENVIIKEGQPVTLDQNGNLIPAVANKPVYGLAKMGTALLGTTSLELRGGLKIGVLKKTLVQLTPNIVDLGEGRYTKEYVWDYSKTFNVMDKVCVGENGLIVPVEGTPPASTFGVVTKVGPDFLEIDLIV